jgi:CRP-like cAMP-binding protein
MSTAFVPDSSVIAAVPLFAGLDAQARDAVVAVAHVKRIVAGDAVFQQGDAADAFFVLVEGYLKAAQTNSAGQQIVVHFVNPGEFFGCVALMEGQRYPATMLALKDSVALAWTRAEIGRWVRHHPTIATNALVGFGGRMLEFQSRLRESQTQKAARRIAQSLLHLTRGSGRKTECGIRIDFPITRQDLAEMAGTTLHTASRTLAGWEKDGILACGRQKITVTDPVRLAMLADDAEEA